MMPHSRRSFSFYCRSSLLATLCSFLVATKSSHSSFSLRLISFNAFLSSPSRFASTNLTSLYTCNRTQPCMYTLKVKIFDLVKSNSDCWRFCFLARMICAMQKIYSYLYHLLSIAGAHEIFSPWGCFSHMDCMCSQVHPECAYQNGEPDWMYERVGRTIANNATPLYRC